MAYSEYEQNRFIRDCLENPNKYWEHEANKLVWDKKWTNVCDQSNAPFTKWFVGGQLNLCYNCLDRHVDEGYGNFSPIHFDSPILGIKYTLNYAAILEKVSKLSGVLRSFGVTSGDHVIIYMPMIPEGIFSMLACARIGAVHLTQPNGLPAHDLAKRFDHCRPKVVLLATHGYHANGWMDYKAIVDQARTASGFKPAKYLVLQRPGLARVNMDSSLDHDWESSVNAATPVERCLPLDASHPALSIYTSGSSGEPKAIVHSVASYSVRMMHDASWLFGLADEFLFFTSSFGWIAGQSFVVNMPLMHRMKTLIFEGDPLLTSDPTCVYRLVAEYKITSAFIRPGVLKYLKSMDPDCAIAKEFDFSNVRFVFSGGERTDRSTYEWAVKAFNSSIYNAYGQTEVSGVICGAPDKSKGKLTHSVSTENRAFPGWNVTIMKHDNTIAGHGVLGRILLKLPLPPGGVDTLLNDKELCMKTYFTTYPGYYDTKDDGSLDEKGRLKVECRADDIMKHAAVYLAAQAVEEIVLRHPSVLDCCVVGFPDLILKEIPVILYTIREDSNCSEQQISSEVLRQVSDHFGSAVTFGKVIRVTGFPKGRTGKVHRGSAMMLVKGNKSKIAMGAIENPDVLPQIERALIQAGYCVTSSE